MKKTVEFQSFRIVRDERSSDESLAWMKDQECRGPGDVARIMHSLTDESPVEEVWAFCLDSRGKIIAATMVSRGTLNEVTIHAREIFRFAILNNARNVIVAHNHPSGNADPSPADLETTERLVLAGKVVGIELLDHVVVAPGGADWKSALQTSRSKSFWDDCEIISTCA